MLMQLNNQEATLVLTDVSPFMAGSVIVTKGKPVMANCQNLMSQSHRSATKNELCSIITKLRAQPDVLTEHTVQVCTDNQRERQGHINVTGDRPWQLILSGSSVTLTHPPPSDPVTADDISGQERRPLLWTPTQWHGQATRSYRIDTLTGLTCRVP